VTDVTPRGAARFYIVDRESELALVRRVRDGDRDAFDEVHALFNARLFGFLARLSRSRDVAEDLLEETWLRLVTHAERLDADTRLGPWLFRVGAQPASELLPISRVRSNRMRRRHRVMAGLHA